MENKNELITRIVDLEWPMFTSVNNEGGRAYCQDDRVTFDIMRRAQFEAWGEAVLLAYLEHIMNARREGRNLITEKYAHMMRTTAPKQYELIADFIPMPSDEAREIAERICGELVAQTAEYAVRYPRMALQGRTLYSKDDSEYNTSIETYQRSELYTYSEEVLRLLESCILEKKAQGVNFAESILLNTVKKYGFSSLEDAEAAV